MALLSAPKHFKYYFKYLYINLTSTTQVPYMSHYLTDMLPWTYCCRFGEHDDPECKNFARQRPSQVCDNYEPPPPGIYFTCVIPVIEPTTSAFPPQGLKQLDYDTCTSTGKLAFQRWVKIITTTLNFRVQRWTLAGLSVS